MRRERRTKTSFPAIVIAATVASLATAPACFAQFQTCVFCDVRPTSPDPFRVDPCETGTLVLRGAGYQDTLENGCSTTPTVGVRTTRPDRLEILSFRVLSDGQIEVEYRVPCDATPGLVGVDVTIDDVTADAIPPYACGNVRLEVQTLVLSVSFDAHAATWTPGGVTLTWRTLDEDQTLAFAIEARDAAGSITRLPDLVFAEGSGASYRYRDERTRARRGEVVAYRLVELTWDGDDGSVSSWFDVETGLDRTAGNRRRRDSRR